MSQRSSRLTATALPSSQAHNSNTTTTTNNNNNNTNNKQYDRIRVLGKGSFGTAIVHRRRADCSLVVLKEIDLQRFKGEHEKLSAINEARIMSTLSHVNIIKYHSAYTTETKLVIEMEYASIGTLASYLSHQVQPLEEQEILIIFRQITSGLSYLHSKNVIHLDLKMANIFVTIEGLVKIGDFSISQYMVADEFDVKAAAGAEASGGLYKRSTSSHLGTLAYSSPERCLGEPTDFKSDIWSLGCILYELISSKPLFSADSLPELVLCITRIQYLPIKRNLTAGLIETFERTIAREPIQRPSAKELHAITGQLLSRAQLLRHKLSKRQQNHRFDLSTEVALLAAQNQDDASQAINYPHSLVYQVRLDAQHIHLGRVNLPQTKRIKEMAKGASHYLVLTYDNIVYGWGSRHRGQLGACGIALGGSQGKLRAANKFEPSSAASSAASSTQTIVTNGSARAATGVGGSTSRQLVMGLLEEAAPNGRPFVINELNHRKIVQVTAGKDFSVFLSKTGIVMTCGDGSRGCLGRGDLKSCCTPCMVEFLLNSDVVRISAGPEHVAAVCGNGRAFTWGKLARGRLGIARDCPNLATISDPSGRHVLTPQQVQFPPDVFIKNVFCADRCTVFIDSQGRCWACGENRHNKLGLDVKRRFKRTLIVEESWTPCEIQQLAKHKISSCSIGRNHSSFVTSEGKLIVFGQDIDYTYRLRSSIMSARDSHRRISFELQTRRRALFSHKQPKVTAQDAPPDARCATSYRSLAHWALVSNQLSGFRSNEKTPEAGASSRHRRLALNRLQQKQIGAYLRKSRSSKKMPFEGAISVSCTAKFTLALTNDNHVYFWGVRSHKQQEVCLAGSRCRSCARRGQPVEPQLVPACSDECFVKIGATNSSLMTSIQILGSDQPIIHAQDPRLQAKSLADLWILDYQTSSCGSSCSSASSCSSCSSNCSLCSSQSSCSQCSSPVELADEQVEELSDCMKHAAILEPQPMVSLYVPSMFNHSGCSMHLVDLFCFDQDRFYLILDTTVMLQLSNMRHSGTPAAQQQPRSSGQTPRSTRLNSLTETRSAQLKRAEDGVASCTASAPGPLDQAEAGKGGQDPPALDADQVTKAEPLDGMSLRSREESAESRCRLASDKGELCCDDNNNNHNNNDSNNSNHNNHNNSESATAISSSHGAVSLEEPRSLSTFATVLGNHIIVGPNMRASHQDGSMLPLSFANQQSHQETTDSTVGSGQVANHLLVDRRSRVMKRVRRQTNKSEITGITNTDNMDDTSSMPSWVRNEYIDQQQKVDASDGSDDRHSNLFSANSFGDETTCASESSIASNQHQLMSGCDLNDSIDNSTDSRLNTPTYRGEASSSCATLPPEDQQSVRSVELQPSAQQQQVASLYRQGKPLLLSRSQPDISETCADPGSLARRASILVEEPARGVNNLLDCSIYQGAARNQYQSSTLDAGLSTRSNSHNPLLRGEQTRLSTYVVNSSSHTQLPVVGANYIWSKLDSDSSYQPASVDAHLRVPSQVVQHLSQSINLQASKPKAASNLSLSSLRKSFVKLFC